MKLRTPRSVQLFSVIRWLAGWGKVGKIHWPTFDMTTVSEWLANLVQHP